MSDSKFEKQVRQKMDELKVTPSAAAWESIESELRAGKRRRFPLWAPLLLLLFIAGGTYFLYTSNHTPGAQEQQAVNAQPGNTSNNSASERTNSDRKTNDKNATNTNAGSSADNSSGDHLREEKPAVLPDQKILNVAKSPIEISAKPQQQTSASDAEKKIRRPVISDPVFRPSSKALSQNRDREDMSLSPSKVQKDKLLNAHGNKGSVEMPLVERRDNKLKNETDHTNADIAEVQNAGKPQSAIKDDQQTKAIAENEMASTPPLNDSPIDSGSLVSSHSHDQKTVSEKAPPAAASLKKSSVISRRPKQFLKGWQFGFTAGIGRAYIGEGKGLNFNKSVVQDISLSVGNQSYAPTALPQYRPSKIKPGMSYAAGFALKKAFTRKLSLSAGLSYALYHTNTEVGYQVNRNQIVNNGNRGYLNVPFYYMNDHSQEFRNRYHFVEVPVNLFIKLGNGNKIPVYWNAGASVSRLISSNSLHFDGTTGVYYKNDNLLRKTQGAITTGFSIVAFNKSALPLWIGPSLRYNVAPMLDKDVSERRRLMSASLDFRIFLK